MKFYNIIVNLKTGKFFHMLIKKKLKAELFDL